MPRQRDQPPQLVIAAENSAAEQCRRTQPAGEEHCREQSRAVPAKPSCPRAEMGPTKRRWPAPPHPLAVQTARAPATVRQEAGDPVRHPGSPSRYRNRGPSCDVETHHPANEFDNRIATRQTAPLHIDLRQLPQAPAAVEQSAKAHRQNPAPGRRDSPAALRESSAHSPAKAHRSESRAPSTTLLAESRTESFPILRSTHFPR